MTALPRVHDLMNDRTEAVRVDDDVGAVIIMLIDRGITGAPVLDGDGRVVGMIGERQCLALLTRGDKDADRPRGTVADFMTTEFCPVTPEMDIYYVAGLFNKHPNRRRFPVIKDDKLVGVITRKDVLRGVRILWESEGA